MMSYLSLILTQKYLYSFSSRWFPYMISSLNHNKTIIHSDCVSIHLRKKKSGKFQDPFLILKISSILSLE
jgi:hypothetical protein